MKRGTIVGLAAGGAAVVAVLAFGWWLMARPQGPDEAARAYLDALASGDFTTIDSLHSQPIDDAVIEQAFAGASAYITDARVIEITESPADEMKVSAEAQLGGETHDLTFTLERTDGRWSLTGDDLGTLRASVALGGAPAGDSVWVGDALAAADADLPLLPAEYDVRPAPRGVLEGDAKALITPGGAVPVAIEATLSPEATAQAQAELDVYLDVCAAAGSAVPSNCGIRVPWPADLTSLDSIVFRIDQRPVLALSADGTGFDATGGVIVATATGASRAGGTGEFTYRADDWAVRGSVRFEGDQMVLSVR